jgi:hypothetical protein
MRVISLPPTPAKSLPVRPRSLTASPAALICAALMLALVFLALQIASVLRTSSFSDCSSIGDSVAESCPI